MPSRLLLQAENTPCLLEEEKNCGSCQASLDQGPFEKLESVCGPPISPLITAAERQRAFLCVCQHDQSISCDQWYHNKNSFLPKVLKIIIYLFFSY